MIMFKINLSEIRYNNTQPKINDVLDRRYLSAKVKANELDYYVISEHLKTAKYTSEQFWNCIGLLRSQWLNPRTQEVQIICYGTAFVVASRFIITCGHNVFNDEDCTTADRCLFIPNHSGRVLEDTFICESAKGVFCRYIPFKKDQDLCARPSPSQICVLVTEKEIALKKYITIGLCDIRQNQQIEAIGYPSRQFSSKPNLFEIDIKRRVEKGQVISIRGSIEYEQFKTISYNLKTKKGMSGSPLLYSYKGEIVCVGIHTHGMEKGVKSGVFFNDFAIKTIKNFEQQLADQYKIPSSIQYNILVKKQPMHHPVLTQKFIKSPYQNNLSYIFDDDQFQQIYNMIKQQIQLIMMQEKPFIEIQLNEDETRQWRNMIQLSHLNLAIA